MRAFLLAYHACLRFGDLQRIRLSSLSLTAQSLRGICWSTKTSRTGQPFAVTLTGLSGRCAASSWCLNYLLCLHRCWLATEAFWRSDVEPDFLLPILPDWASKATTDFAFKSPMSYSQALPALRACMQLSSPKAPNTACQEEAQAFTIHSLKVGLLSAAKQQRLLDRYRCRLCLRTVSTPVPTPPDLHPPCLSGTRRSHLQPQRDLAPLLTPLAEPWIAQRPFTNSSRSAVCTTFCAQPCQIRATKASPILPGPSPVSTAYPPS